MDTADFVGNIATNVAADWTQALIAPIGIVGWKACRGAWEKRPRHFRDAFSLIIHSRWWRNPANWAAIALYPMVFLPYAIASTIWFSPLMLIANAPIARSLRDSGDHLPNWITIVFFMLCMIPVALISFERLFLRESPLREAINLYIDGIAVWLFILGGCAVCAAAFLPLALLVRILEVPLASGMMMAVQLIFVMACIAVSFGFYWLGCLFIARGRVIPQMIAFFRYVAALRRRSSAPQTEPFG